MSLKHPESWFTDTSQTKQQHKQVTSTTLTLIHPSQVTQQLLLLSRPHWDNEGLFLLLSMYSRPLGNKKHPTSAPHHMKTSCSPLSPQPFLSSSGKKNRHIRYLISKQTHTQLQGKGRGAVFQIVRLKQSLTELIQVTQRKTWLWLQISFCQWEVQIIGKHSFP